MRLRPPTSPTPLRCTLRKHKPNRYTACTVYCEDDDDDDDDDDYDDDDDDDDKDQTYMVAIFSQPVARPAERVILLAHLLDIVNIVNNIIFIFIIIFFIIILIIIIVIIAIALKT